jgi:peptidoglycan/LPS O-acetylase OafA/YrhL
VLERTLADARANADLARGLQSRLVEFALAWKVRNAVRRARLHTLAAAAVVALGAVLFVSATHEKEPAKPPSPAASPSATR